MSKTANLAHYFRYLWEEPDLLILTGDANEIFKGREAYNLRYNIKPDEAKDDLRAKRMFAAVGLAAVSLAERESWGWSAALPGGFGMFAAIEPEGMICGKVMNVNKEIVAVQRQKTGEEPTQSYFTPESEDPVRTIEQYFEESDQTLTRIAVKDDFKCALVRAMPNGDFGRVANLSDDELVDFCFEKAAENNLKRLNEVLVFYECRCNDEMILNMITSLPANQREELWGDLQKLEIECPRCGRQYTLNRQG